MLHALGGDKAVDALRLHLKVGIVRLWAVAGRLNLVHTAGKGAVGVGEPSVDFRQGLHAIGCVLGVSL